MRTNPASRTRYTGFGGVVAGVARIAQGVFGMGNPAPGLASQAVALTPEHGRGIYQFFEGDVFLPGTGNWAVDPTHDGPLYTVWGHAFLRTPNTFAPLQPAQLYTAASSLLYGVGGVVAGQLFNQPLSNLQETVGEPSQNQGGVSTL